MYTVERQLEEELEGCRSFFRLFQLPLSLVQSALTLSLLARSITSQTRIHHFYLWIAICFACALACITAFISIFVHKTLHKLDIPSRNTTWLIRGLYALCLGWLVIAIMLARTPTNCQNVSYCAQHRAVIAFSFIICILSFIGAAGHHMTVHAVPHDQPHIVDNDQKPEDKDAFENAPPPPYESPDSDEPVDGPVEEGSKECSEKHAAQMEVVDLEKGDKCCAMCKGRLEGT